MKVVGKKAGVTWAWPVLAILLLFEFLLFDHQTSVRWTWIFPRWNDQIQYLTESYTGYEYLRIHGWFAGIWNTLVNSSAQGTLHDFYAVLIFSVAGPSRSAALAVNMLALIAWQISLFWVVRRETDSPTLPWIAAALPLALHYPWGFDPGSIFDFRLDHLAMCTFGVCLSSALATKGFRLTKFSLLFGFLVGVTLLTRFLTGTYFIVIYFCALVFTFCRPDRVRRTLNLLASAVTGAITAGPVFWINREWIWNYYVIGHFVGPESAIRNPHMGLGRSIDFVFSCLWREQLGVFFLIFASVATIGLIGCHFRDKSVAGKNSAAIDRSWLFFGLTFFAAPALVLTLHQLKSNVVMGVLVPGALIVLLAVWRKLLPTADRVRFTQVPAIVITSTAVIFFIAQQFQPVGDPAFLADARRVNVLADQIYQTSLRANLANPRIAVDQVTDYFDGQVMRVICYERHRKWIPFIMTLPTGIAEDKEALLLERVANSDFVFLTESGPSGRWPYDRQMQALLPKTQGWCDQHLKVQERFPLFDRRMVLYQRPDLP